MGSSGSEHNQDIQPQSSLAILKPSNLSWGLKAIHLEITKNVGRKCLSLTPVSRFAYLYLTLKRYGEFRKSRSKRTLRETSALTLLYSWDNLASRSGIESSRILTNRGQQVPCFESRPLAFCFEVALFTTYVNIFISLIQPRAFSVSFRRTKATYGAFVLDISQPLSIFLYNVR